MSSRAKQEASAERPVPGIPSLLSAEIVLRGTIESAGEIQFGGVIEGDLIATRLVIAEGARVTGDVRAEEVRVCGRVEGTIRAGHVDLAGTAEVRGDVIHRTLSIEAGARLDGTARRADEPLAEVASDAGPARAMQAALERATG